MSTIKVITREAYDRLAEQCEALQVKLARRDALLREALPYLPRLQRDLRERIKHEIGK